MRPRQPTSHPAAIAGRSRSRFISLLVFLLVTACSTTLLNAQETPQSIPDNSVPYTLHLYARLVELPTFILPLKDQKPTLLDPQRIDIKLNSEQPFHPSSLRLQGDDPLSISILLDVSGDQPDLLSALQKSLSAWVTKSLHPQDHVSIYALDCDLLQTSNDVVADPLVLQRGFDLALTSSLTHGTSNKPSCGKSLRLHNSMALLMRKLDQLPGRRILLVFTGGRDGKNTITWSQLSSEAMLDSVTIFAFTPPDLADYQWRMNIYTLTQQSGGFMFTPGPTLLPNALNQVITLLRSRYILQFPMPPHIDAGLYHVYVTVPKYDALIRPAGISVPFRNPSLDHPSTDLPYEAPPTSSTPQLPTPQPSTPQPPTPNR